MLYEVSTEKRQEGTHYTTCYIPFGAACCTKCQQRETTRGYPLHHLLYNFRRCILYEVSTEKRQEGMRLSASPLSYLHTRRYAEDSSLSSRSSSACPLPPGPFFRPQYRNETADKSVCHNRVLSACRRCDGGGAAPALSTYLTPHHNQHEVASQLAVP